MISVIFFTTGLFAYYNPEDSLRVPIQDKNYEQILDEMPDRRPYGLDGNLLKTEDWSEMSDSVQASEEEQLLIDFVNLLRSKGVSDATTQNVRNVLSNSVPLDIVNALGAFVAVNYFRDIKMPKASQKMVKSSKEETSILLESIPSLKKQWKVNWKIVRKFYVGGTTHMTTALDECCSAIKSLAASQDTASHKALGAIMQDVKKFSVRADPSTEKRGVLITILTTLKSLDKIKYNSNVLGALKSILTIEGTDKGLREVTVKTLVKMGDKSMISGLKKLPLDREIFEILYSTNDSEETKNYLFTIMTTKANIGICIDAAYYLGKLETSNKDDKIIAERFLQDVIFKKDQFLGIKNDALENLYYLNKTKFLDTVERILELQGIDDRVRDGLLELSLQLVGNMFSSEIDKELPDNTTEVLEKVISFAIGEGNTEIFSNAIETYTQKRDSAMSESLIDICLTPRSELLSNVHKADYLGFAGDTIRNFDVNKFQLKMYRIILKALGTIGDEVSVQFLVENVREKEIFRTDKGFSSDRKKEEAIWEYALESLLYLIVSRRTVEYSSPQPFISRKNTQMENSIIPWLDESGYLQSSTIAVYVIAPETEEVKRVRTRSLSGHPEKLQLQQIFITANRIIDKCFTHDLAFKVPPGKRIAIIYDQRKFQSRSPHSLIPKQAGNMFQGYGAVYIPKYLQGQEYLNEKILTYITTHELDHIALNFPALLAAMKTGAIILSEEESRSRLDYTEVLVVWDTVEAMRLLEQEDPFISFGFAPEEKTLSKVSLRDERWTFAEAKNPIENVRNNVTALIATLVDLARFEEDNIDEVTQLLIGVRWQLEEREDFSEFKINVEDFISALFLQSIEIDPQGKLAHQLKKILEKRKFKNWTMLEAISEKMRPNNLQIIDALRSILTDT